MEFDLQRAQRATDDDRPLCCKRDEARVLPVLVPVKLTAAYGPNARHHWAARSRLTRELRETTTLALLAQWGPERRAAVPSWGPLILDIAYYRTTRQRPADDDNLTASVKPCRDALANTLGIDDRIIATGTVRQAVDPENRGCLLLTLRPATEEEPG